MTRGVKVRAEEMARQGAYAGAWETLERAWAQYPDDAKLNQLRADMTTRASDFVKVIRTAEWLATMGLTYESFGRIHMYSDSANDLPLMEQATDPIATNPAPSLETIARERGWPILKLFP